MTVASDFSINIPGTKHFGFVVVLVVVVVVVVVVVLDVHGCSQRAPDTLVQGISFHNPRFTE